MPGKREAIRRARRYQPKMLAEALTSGETARSGKSETGCGAMREVRFDAGERIFAEGDPSDCCYRVLSGRIEIRLQLPGVMRRDRSKTIAVCGPGELIGEMSVIDSAPRSATAVALEPCVCQAYSAEEILHLLENDPQEALSYVRTLIRRIRESNRRVLGPTG